MYEDYSLTPDVVEDGVEVPIERLSADALDGVVEAFVLQEGTDYGENELPIVQKKQDVMAQLRAGEAMVVFDATTSSCSIRMRRDEAERSSIPGTLGTLADLRELLLDHYDKLDPKARALVPLQKLYWPVE